MAGLRNLLRGRRESDSSMSSRSNPEWQPDAKSEDSSVPIKESASPSSRTQDNYPLRGLQQSNGLSQGNSANILPSDFTAPNQHLSQPSSSKSTNDASLGPQQNPPKYQEKEHLSETLDVFLERRDFASCIKFRDDVRTTSPFYNVRADDIPNWRWSTHECRAWIKDVCAIYLGMTDAAGEAVAQHFDGFGPTLYMKHKEWWTRNLGEDCGSAVYIWILLARTEFKSYVPYHYIFDHGNEYIDKKLT